MKPYYETELGKLYHGDCLEIMPMLGPVDFGILDPPFLKWESLKRFNFSTIIAFTNFQNRGFVDKLYGKPRFEIVWHYKDGRWVSHKLPRLTHEYIYLYGDTNECYVGEKNNLKKQNKGKGCVGSDRLEERVYKPRERKMLNSVIEIPRNVSNGLFAKPLKLIQPLIEWVGKDVLDPFLGSGTTAVACERLNRPWIGIEIEEKYCEIAAKRIEKERQQLKLF